MSLNKNHLPSVDLDMISVVTLSDLPKTMVDSTEKYFSGSMYEYDGGERREIEVKFSNIPFGEDGH